MPNDIINFTFIDSIPLSTVLKVRSCNFFFCYIVCKTLRRLHPHECFVLLELSYCSAYVIGLISRSSFASVMLARSGGTGHIGICSKCCFHQENVAPKNLHKIFQDMWEIEDIPQSWKKGLIVKLPQNGDLGDCNNLRGITLLSTTSEVFTRIIFTRIIEAIDEVLVKNKPDSEKKNLA